MKRILVGVMGVAAVGLLVGVAFAQMGGGGMGGGMGQGMMGGGHMGSGMMGGTTGQGVPQITEDQVRAAAQQYIAQNKLPYAIGRTIPLTGMHMAMYEVDLVDAQNATQTILHVNPWGNVMAVSGPTTP